VPHDGLTSVTQTKTLSVPEAGRLYFGLSRNGSYDAAARGEIPTVRVGRLLRVPIIAMDRLLEEAVLAKPPVGSGSNDVP
jgi:hypothetical protein